MLAHLGHFVGAIFGIFFSSIGTTLLGKLLDIGLAVLITLYAVHRLHKRGGMGAVRLHWDEDLKFTVRTSLIAAAIIYTPVFLWSVGKAAYSDHEDLVNRSRQQRASLARDAGVLQLQKSDDAAALIECNTNNARAGGRNETLSQQNRDQENTINNCQTQALKLLTPEPQKLVALMLQNANEGIGEQNVKWLLLINRTIDPVTLDVRCKQRLTEVDGWVIGGVTMGEGNSKLSDYEYLVRIASPAWGPESPLEVDTHYIGGDDVECGFLLR